MLKFKSEIDKWKWLHNLLVKIRIGQIKHSNKEQYKKARIEKIKAEAKQEWIAFANKHGDKR